MCDLAGSKGPKVKDGKSLPPNLYIGHFMKPYFKDRVTGVVSSGGPALIREGGGSGSVGRGCHLHTCRGCCEFPWIVQGNSLQSPSNSFQLPVVKVRVSGPGTW